MLRILWDFVKRCGPGGPSNLGDAVTQEVGEKRIPNIHQNVQTSWNFFKKTTRPRRNFHTLLPMVNFEVRHSIIFNIYSDHNISIFPKVSTQFLPKAAWLLPEIQWWSVPNGIWFRQTVAEKWCEEEDVFFVSFELHETQCRQGGGGWLKPFWGWMICHSHSQWASSSVLTEAGDHSLGWLQALNVRIQWLWSKSWKTIIILVDGFNFQETF